MSFPKKKSKALELRKQGYSYSQIKKEMKVSKSSLSLWLRDFPLSDKRIRELRDNSEVRIEKCRITKELKKKKRLDKVYFKVRSEVGKLSKRELKLCGMFLYWAEGTKVSTGSVVISNTDYHLVKFFLITLLTLGIKKDKIFVRLQLYKDMDINEEIDFWSNFLKISKSNFKKPYIKKSNLIDINYKNGFGHGTCSLLVYDINLYNYVISNLKYFRDYALLRKI